MPEYNFPNTENLREVRTVLEPGAVLDLQQQGRVCLKRNVCKNQEYSRKCLKVRNKNTGKVVDVPESREIIMQYSGERVTYPKDEWISVEEYESYPREKPAGVSVAYYVLPPDPVVGERFYIPQMIEDCLVTEFWYSIYLAGSGFAVWNGVELELDKSVFESVYLIG